MQCIVRNIADKDIVTPETGREVAKDIGAPYYETSVLSQHGVEDLFINSVRAALIERRKIKFWSAQLRRVQRPLIQVFSPECCITRMLHFTYSVKQRTNTCFPLLGKNVQLYTTPVRHKLGIRLYCVVCESCEL